MKNYVKRPIKFGWRTVTNWASNHAIKIGEPGIIGEEKVRELDVQYNEKLSFDLKHRVVFDDGRMIGTWCIEDIYSGDAGARHKVGQVRVVTPFPRS